MKIKEIPVNKEKLYKIACTGDSPAVKKDGEIVGCVAMSREGSCEDCIANHSDKPCMNVISTYLNQEYCEYEKGELVEVSDDTIEWKLRYFACMSEDPKFPYGTLPVYSYNRDASYTVNYVYCRKYGTLGGLKSNEKQVPMKPSAIVTDYGVMTEFQCSACGTIHRASDTKGLNKCKYCDECGQMIDWGGSKYYDHG